MMKRRRHVSVGGGLLLLALTMVVGAQVGDAESPQPTDGTDHQAQRLLAARCTVCHSIDLIVQQRLDRKHWSTIVKKMSSWGAQVSESEQEVLIAYLASRYHPDAGSVTIDEPAKKGKQRIFEEILKVLIANIDFPVVAAFLELVGVALADRIAGRVWMLLPDRDEFSPESEADDCDVELLSAHEMEDFELVAEEC